MTWSIDLEHVLVGFVISHVDDCVARLYALSEFISEAQVNGALRRLLETHRKAEAPLATTRDLYRELRAVTPDSLKYLLHDLFEVNTFWELEAEQVTAEPGDDGS